MTKSCLLIAAVVVAAAVLTTADAGEDSVWIPTNSPGTCQGSIAECMTDDGEFEMDSEINRRMLATKAYISYGALRAGTTPCYRRGSSYYNCRSGGKVNPYTRGCNAITRCTRNG